MQAIAILSVLITAPIGAIGINLTCEKLLHTESKIINIEKVYHINRKNTCSNL